MNSLLFDRASGSLPATAFARTQSSRLVHTIQPSPKARFNGGEKEVLSDDDNDNDALAIASTTGTKIWAHQSGVNALGIDIEKKFLISGGADSSIKLWDLEARSLNLDSEQKPAATISRTASTHQFGITHLTFYPFDSAAFLSSSYDHHLKVYATETQTVSADFDMNSIVYTHALSPIANHLLVACATQHPTVRLVDLRSGSNTHSLAGHHGALLSLSWSPRIEHILASGGVDGTVRIWDIRKSSAALGVLDMEDSIGILGVDGLGKGARPRDSGKAHQAAVNGLTWTGDGKYIVSAGHDQRVRVWDASTGANTLASFGPILKNNHLSTLPLLISPTISTMRGQDLLFYPNERELLVFDLHQGVLLKRLRVTAPHMSTVRSRTGERNVKNRVTGMITGGPADGIYSSHTDGQIRAWLPRTVEDEDFEKDHDSSKRHADIDDNEGAKKRQVLETVYRDLTKDKITFG